MDVTRITISDAGPCTCSSVNVGVIKYKFFEQGESNHLERIYSDFVTT